MGLFTNGLFGAGGFGGMGMGGSQLWGTSAATPGTLAGGQTFDTGLTADMISNSAGTGAMNIADPNAMNGLYNKYGATAMGDVISTMTPGQQQQIGRAGTANPNMFTGAGSNVATMSGGAPGTPGMLTGTGESFNNAARTGLLGYIGVNNVKNANQGMDYMGQKQATQNHLYATNEQTRQENENLNF